MTFKESGSVSFPSRKKDWQPPGCAQCLDSGLSSSARETTSAEKVPYYMYLLYIKGTVHRDGRGYKSGINRKVSLNPITAGARNVFLLRPLALDRNDFKFASALSAIPL